MKESYSMRIIPLNKGIHSSFPIQKNIFSYNYNNYQNNNQIHSNQVFKRNNSPSQLISYENLFNRGQTNQANQTNHINYSNKINLPTSLNSIASPIKSQEITSVIYNDPIIPRVQKKTLKRLQYSPDITHSYKNNQKLNSNLLINN